MQNNSRQERQLTQLSERNVELARSNARFSQRIYDLESDLLNERQKNVQSSFDNNPFKVSRMQSDIQDLNGQIDELKTVNSNLQKQIQHLKRINNDVSERNAHLESIIENLEEETDLQQENNDNRQHQVEEVTAVSRKRLNNEQEEDIFTTTKRRRKMKKLKRQGIDLKLTDENEVIDNKAKRLCTSQTSDYTMPSLGKKLRKGDRYTFGNQQ